MEKYLILREKGEEFKLYNKKRKLTRSFPSGVEEFLHEELSYIIHYEGRFKNKFDFSFLAEQTEKMFVI